MMHAFALYLCLLASSSQAVEIAWGAVQAGGFSSSIRVPGHVIAKEGALSIESARVQGRITKILRREGEGVSAGEALFSINSPECMSLAQEKEVAEKRGLKDLIEAARHREEQLGISVANGECLFLASHDGTLIKRQLELGAAFNIGDSLAMVLDIANLGIELDIPERNLGQINRGQAVRVQLAANPEVSLKGTVASILPTIDPLTRSGKVRLSDVVLPARSTLDALVFAEIDTARKQQAFKVPTSALVFSRNKQYVIKKTPKATVAVPVDVLNESANESTVRPSEGETLQLGDQVAVKGAIFLLKKLGEG